MGNMASLSPTNVRSLISDNNPCLVHLNARSLRRNHDNISSFLTSLSVPFSFICITETWLCQADTNMFGFPSYQSEYCHRSNDCHGGSAIFISDKIPYTRRRDISIPIAQCESVWIELDHSFLSVDSKKFVLGCIYRSPSSCSSEFMIHLDRIFNILAAENKHVLIVGDININLLDIDNRLCVNYTDCFSGFGYEQLITSPTRCTLYGRETLLDHALTNITPAPISGVIKTDISDHYPIFIIFNSSTSSDSTRYLAKVFDKSSFIEDMSNIDWSEVDQVQDPECALESFCDFFREAVSRNTIISKCKRRYNSPRCPWITKGLLKSMRKKENLYKKTKKRPFNLKLASRYKKYCNILNSLLKKAKKSYYEKEFISRQNNSKRKWELLNTFLNRTTCHTSISKIMYNDCTYDDALEIANAFSDFFFEIYNQDHTGAECSMSRVNFSFFLFPVTSEEVFTTIKSLKDTSPGLDDIHARHLKMVGQLISPTLASIINSIFKTGIFPRTLKNTKVIPIFKKGDRSIISNYRPISILSSVSKIFEKLFVSRLNSYLKKFNLLNDRQFGFRSGSSTDLAVISLTDYINSSIDK